MIGERIRHLRKKRNMTLQQLADELGIAFTTLGNYERGDRQPDFQLVLDIAKYFGVSMDNLTRKEPLTDDDDYRGVSYTEDLNTLFNKADPESRKQLLDLYDQLFSLIVEHSIANQNNKELELLQKVVTSVSNMKNGFGTGIKKGGYSPSKKFEISKAYLKEKEKIDKYFNELFEIYIERSVK